jgi:type II secretory ATPase GspE/PulE/Tfp pilus assembly ATPase PilB-like protein
MPDEIFKRATEAALAAAAHGYSGRLARPRCSKSEPVGHAIASGANGLDLLILARQEGMVPMYEEVLYRVLEGTTSLEELARVIS